MRNWSILGLAAIVMASAPVWLFLAAKGRYGGDAMLYRKDGLGNWKCVARSVRDRVKAYVRVHGGLPSRVEDVYKAGLLDPPGALDCIPRVAPRTYSPRKWRYVSSVDAPVHSDSAVLCYDIPGCRRCVGNRIYISDAGDVGYSLVRPWHPRMWWEVVAPHGVWEFLGLEVVCVD